MTELADIYIRLGIKLEPNDQLLFKAKLGDDIRKIAPRLFQQSAEILVVVQEGTVKTWVKAVGTIAGLIAGYGGLRDGLAYLRSDGVALYHTVNKIVHDAGIPDEYVLTSQKKSSVPDLLTRALKRLDKLERVGTNISATEYEHEIHLARRDIRKALSLTDRSEKPAVIEQITREAQKHLPSLPPLTLFGEAPLALRPEDFDYIEPEDMYAPPQRSQFQRERLPTRKLPEPLFRVEKSASVLRLHKA